MQVQLHIIRLISIRKTIIGGENYFRLDQSLMPDWQIYPYGVQSEMLRKYNHNIEKIAANKIKSKRTLKINKSFSIIKVVCWQ